MSPRRKIHPDEQPLLASRAPGPQRGLRWRSRLRRPRLTGLPFLTTVAAALMAAAITGSALMLDSHLRSDSAAEKDRAVLSYVSRFMTEFTSVDPFNANDYMKRILAEATGDFAKQYNEKANEILIEIAEGDRTTGVILEAGVERWNDDGSATVLVATQVTLQTPDGKQEFNNTDRWVATAQQEGSAWKISNLSQVI